MLGRYRKFLLLFKARSVQIAGKNFPYRPRTRLISNLKYPFDHYWWIWSGSFNISFYLDFYPTKINLRTIVLAVTFISMLHLNESKYKFEHTWLPFRRKCDHYTIKFSTKLWFALDASINFYLGQRSKVWPSGWTQFLEESGWYPLHPASSLVSKTCGTVNR